MLKLKLYTTQDQFEAAHEIADKGRARKVEIPRDLLSVLLMDYSEMVSRLNRDNYNTIVWAEDDDGDTRE
jgi:hypothetical protein